MYSISESPRRVVLLALVLALFGLRAEVVQAQLLGFGMDRTHPELRWMEFETEHFIIIYPGHLSATAEKVASVAEQVYGPVTAAMELHERSGKIAITITEEDQIVNGFALPGKMFLWVNQNDGPAYFSGTEKWLRKVIAHELQHDMWMEAAMDWTGIWSLLGTPAWFIEGLAEYETEEWGAYRSDLRVRDHILRNRQDDLDPHDSGFTRVRYLADTYGDSTIVGAIQKRGFLGVSNFDAGFEEKAGVTVAEFEEEWRRVANAYTYAIWSQKERVTDIGDAVDAPLQRIAALEYDADASHVAVLAQPRRAELPILAVVSCDSTKSVREIDHGQIDRDFAFSPDGRYLIYAKLHRVDHGGLIWDLKVADVQTGRTHWITHNRRASHPDWSPAGDRIVHTAIDGETTNLYVTDPFGDHTEAITRHGYDVQCFAPRFDAAGTRVVYSKFESGRGVDIALLDLESSKERYLTASTTRDLRPRWSADGRSIYFTGDRNSDHVPNLYRVPVDGGEDDVVAMTDVGEALFGMDVNPTSGAVTGLAMASVDTTRLRAVDAARTADVVEPVIDERLVRWRESVPPLPIGDVDPLAPAERSEPRAYRSWRRMDHFLSFVWPSPIPWGMQFGSLFMDKSHKTSLGVAVDIGTNTDADEDGAEIRGFYAHLETIRPPLRLPGSLAIWGGPKFRQGFRLYGDELLSSLQTGFGIRWSQPLNLGEHLYANHQIQLQARYTEVELLDFDELDLPALVSEGLALPAEDYVQSILELRYVYTKRRPQPFLNSHATRGHGLLARFQWASESLGGDLEFTRLNFDGSLSTRLPFIRVPIFARARYESTTGTTASQDFSGLRAEPSIVPVAYNLPGILENAFDLPDQFGLRGYARNIVGEAALVTTLETRLPLLGPLPVSAFGFSPGGLSAVLFYDHGRVWADGEEFEARHTVGWELRLPLRLGGTTLVVPSYGEGQTLEWENANSPILKDEYFQLAFTQGF